jgi:hypothetical protein
MTSTTTAPDRIPVPRDRDNDYTWQAAARRAIEAAMESATASELG